METIKYNSVSKTHYVWNLTGSRCWRRLTEQRTMVILTWWQWKIISPLKENNMNSSILLIWWKVSYDLGWDILKVWIELITPKLRIEIYGMLCNWVTYFCPPIRGRMSCLSVAQSSYNSLDDVGIPTLIDLHFTQTSIWSNIYEIWEITNNWELILLRLTDIKRQLTMLSEEWKFNFNFSIFNYCNRITGE